MQKSTFSIISEKYRDVFKCDAYLAPDIPEKKMNGAIENIARRQVLPNQVLLIFDSTLFGGAGEGVLMTRDTLFYKAIFSTPHQVDFVDISSAEYVRDVSVNKKGKEVVSESVQITTTKGDKWEIKAESNINFEALSLWIKELGAVSRQQGEDTENSRLEHRSLESMPMTIRLTYLKIVINSMLDDDGKIDEEEFSQLYSLIARLEIPADERFSLLLYQNKTRPTEQLIVEMCEPLDEMAKQEIQYSLMKDLIYIQMHIKDNTVDYQTIPFIKKFAALCQISSEQMDLFKQTIDNDRKIFDDDADDSILEAGYRNIAKGAAAVGVPLAALYFSGSVVGLSAAGITSGLATLGLGGLFGLSSMVTGIGAVILLGIGAKKGIEHLTGQNDIDKRKRKEALLFAVNKHLQKSINMLMQDINYFTGQLAEEIKKSSSLAEREKDQQVRIKHLIEHLRMMTGGGNCLSQQSEYAELMALRQSLPHRIDVERLRSITSTPTTQEFYDIALSFYDKIAVPESKEGGEAYVLRDNLSRDEAAYLSGILKRLDYFSAAALARQGLQNLSSLFRK